MALGLLGVVGLVLAAAALWTVVSNGPGAAPEIRVDRARSGERVGTTAAVYLDVSNEGGGDRIVRVTSPAASRALVHGTDDAGMMQTSEGLDVPGGSTVRLVPGGEHVMLEGVGSRLEPGDVFPVRIEFERHAPVDVEVRVVALEDLAGEGTP